MRQTFAFDFRQMHEFSADDETFFQDERFVNKPFSGVSAGEWQGGIKLNGTGRTCSF
jgi:hypothetical protein